MRSLLQRLFRCAAVAFCAVLVPPSSAVVGSAFSYGNVRAGEQTYIDLDALHRSLQGSKLHDAGCLLFRAAGCDVVVLADESKQVRYMILRVADNIRNKSKRREVLERALQTLKIAYDLPVIPDQMVSVDARMALLHYEAYNEEASGQALVGVERCKALQNLLKLYDYYHVELSSATGLSCSFMVIADGVQLELSFDLRNKIVQYVEVRGVKIIDKGFRPKPDKSVAEVFSTLENEPDSRHVSLGGEQYTSLKTDGNYYLVRNGKFYLVGTLKTLSAAVKKGADMQNNNFLKANFSSLTVSLPSSSVAAKLLTRAPDPPKPVKPTPPRVEPPAPVEQPKEPVVEKKKEELPPLTPEQAREAYLKMLREM